MKKKFFNPAAMIEQGAPRLIHSDGELARYTEALFGLTSKDGPTAAEIEAINLLSLLVEKYESERYRIAAATPLEVLRFLMDQHGLQQCDLKDQLGSESNVSLILSGKRNLTVPHIQRLSVRFGVPASIFLGSMATAA